MGDERQSGKESDCGTGGGTGAAEKNGFLNTMPYRAIFLTDAGHKLAAECKQRHETVVSFLRLLGISERIAELNAEGIEHHVSPETLAVFERWLKKS